MESKLLLNERVENKKRFFGSNMTYFPCTIKTVSGDEVKALFTKNQLKVAMKRAERNQEDFEEKAEGFWGRLFK